MSFEEIFNPGMRHFREEQQRKRIEAQIPESEGDPLRDFENGIIRIPAKPAAGEPSHDADTLTSATREHDGHDDHDDHDEQDQTQD